jgi:hypothetical protein
MPKCHRLHWGRESQSIKTESPKSSHRPKKKAYQREALLTRRESGERKQKTGKGRPNLTNSDTRRLEAQISSVFRNKTTKTSASQQEDGTHTMVKENLKNQGKPLKLREGSSEARQQRWWGTTTRPCVRACASERENRERERCGCSRVLT